MTGSSTRRSSEKGWALRLMMRNGGGHAGGRFDCRDPVGQFAGGRFGQGNRLQSGEQGRPVRAAGRHSRRNDPGGGTLIAAQADRALPQKYAGLALPSGRIKRIFHTGPQESAFGARDGLPAEREGRWVRGGDGGNGRRRKGGIDREYASFHVGDRDRRGWRSGWRECARAAGAMRAGRAHRAGTRERRSRAIPRRAAMAGPRPAGRACGESGSRPPGRGGGWCGR